LQAQELREEYLEVKEVLAKESRLLDEIETERRLGADAWRASNRIDFSLSICY